MIINKLIMTTKHFLLISGALLLIRCGNPAKNDTMTSDKSDLKDSCCVKNKADKKSEISSQSLITCPNCAHEKMETLPTDVCVIKYKCEKCSTEMTPIGNDCCVFALTGHISVRQCNKKSELVSESSEIVILPFPLS